MPGPLAPLLLTAGVSLAKEFLPDLIGEIAGDKAEKVAELVVDTAATVTGATHNEILKDPDIAAAQLRANPNLVMELRDRAAARILELEKAYLQDRQNARRRDVELHKAGFHNWWADVMVISAMTALVVIVLVVYQAYIEGKELDAGLMSFMGMVAGAVLAMLKDAFAFEFGSSRSSRDKTDALINGGRP